MDGSLYELIDRKSVMDFDGFYTDYSWYVNTESGMHVMVFGDCDIYKPEDGNYDNEFETYQEAEEWFNAYNGADDSIEESVVPIDAVTTIIDESTQPDTKPISRFMYKGYICDKCEDGYKIYTTTEWQFGRGLRLSEATVADEIEAKRWIDNTLMGGIGISSYGDIELNPVEESKIRESSTYNDLYNEVFNVLEPIFKKWEDYIGDKVQFAELVGRVADDVFDASIVDEATNASSVGQHKSGSIDLIEGEEPKLEKRVPINRRKN